MQISGTAIAESLQTQLAKEFKKLRKFSKGAFKLIVFLVGESPEQLSFVKIKQRLAKELGIEFEFIHIKNTPTFMDLIKHIKSKSLEKEVSGIIIQQPLPSQLQTDSIYDFISEEKEIEGHRRKTSFVPPLGLAVLTMLKYIYTDQNPKKQTLVNLPKDAAFFKKAFKNKKIVLVGRGPTGGKPIGQTLSMAKMNYFGIHSQTPNPEEYYRDADVIITAVGKKVITPDMLKPGAILINVGLRHEDGKLKGDYSASEIKDIASYYTPTPGGVGPLDVLYLYANLLQSVKMQLKK